jgi:DNA sulfur modification protein DndD
MIEKNSLLIHKIEINNCGGFRGSHELEFSTDTEKNITVIQAESGRGKSTAFQLIYWCLYGEFFKPQSNTTLDDEGLINLPSLNELQLGKKVTGSVSLTVNDENGELYVLTRSATATKLRDENGKKWDKLNNSRINSGIQIVSDCKLRLKDEKEGGMITERDESLINAEIRSYLPKELSDFVLFDGENLMKFQNSDDSKEIIMDGIQKLSGLPVVDSLIESTVYTNQEIKKLVARKTGGADGEALARALQDVHDDIAKQEKIKETNKGLLAENRMRYNELQEILSKTKAGKDVKSKIEKKDTDIKNLKKIQNKISDEIKQFLFKNIPYLLIRNTLLESQKDFGRLEELQKIPPSITSEGIDKLRNALKCVCGRDFEENDEVWDELGRVKETIIDSDMVSSISQGRGLISQIVDQSNPEKIRLRYDELEDNEIDITRQLKLAKTELADLYEERRSLPSSGTETNEQLDKKSRDLFTGIGKIQSKIDDAEEELLNLEDDKTNLNKKYEDAVSHGEKFQDDKDKVTILNAIEKLSKAKKKEISDILRDTAEKATNEYFMMSAPQKEEFDKVMITSNYNILAVDKNDNSKLTSMGQAHVLGLSYVFGCRKITEKNTFLFIDSPLHNISGKFRNEVAEVLAKYLPNVQIVLFVTDTEYTSGPRGEIPVRDILKPSNKIWKEYEIELCETEDGNPTRCFKEMK